MNTDRVKISSILKYIVLSVSAIVYVYPLFWLVINSLKSTPEIFANPWGLPKVFRWENYYQAWVIGKTGIYFLNSVIVTASALLLLLLFSTMAAFAIARMKWRLSGVVIVFFLVGMMIPIHATLLPLFMTFAKLKMINNIMTLVLLYASFGLPAAILIMSNFLQTFPREVEEAAAIDGASMATIFWRITLPMSQAAIFTVLIFSFASIWNELLVALVFISDPEKMTLPVGLMNFKGQYATNYAPLLSATILTIVPSIILYALFSNQINEGMTAGALKG